MMRSLSIFCIAATALALTGCVLPPVVSLSDADPVTDGQEATLTPLVGASQRALLDEYRKATVEFLPQDHGVVDPPKKLPTEIPRVALRQATLQPVEQIPVNSSDQSTLEISRVALRQATLQPVGPTPILSTEQTPQRVSQPYRIKPLQDISLDITPPALFTEQQQPMALPQNEGAQALPMLAQEQPFARDDMVTAGYEWHPSVEGLEFCYQPLYFEEVNLERYGRSFGIVQPAVSAAMFVGRVPLLPYMTFARPARQCTMHPHWSLPGYKIPHWEKQPIVPSVTGSAAEVAALYGIILLIP